MNRIYRWLRDPRMLWVALPVFIMCLSITSWSYFTQRAERLAVQRLATIAEETLQVQSEAIVSLLEKYRYLPALVAQRPVVQSFLARSPGARRYADPGLTSLLTRTAALAGAVDIALAAADGEVLATSSGFVTRNMIEGNELRIAPLQGRLGRASISGADGRRTYAFSSAVEIAGQRRGMVIVVAPIEGIERAWALSGVPIFATNSAGQIVASNPLTREPVEVAQKALNARTLGIGETVVTGTGAGYLYFARTIMILGWELHVLEDRAPLVASAASAGTISILGSALAGLIVMLLFSRMQQRMRKERLEKANALRLERKVRERTRELSQANIRLEAEVVERVQAETALLKAQKDLIHAEKLAAIGQVSATLAHEYNQPLAAVRTYAENAERYLDRGNSGKALENLVRISQLVDRLAHLSRTLLTFARRQEKDPGPVLAGDALADALVLVGIKLKNAGVLVETAPAVNQMPVIADRLRLGQVFANLLANAADAMRESTDPRIEIDGNNEGGSPCITVSDNGTGIADADMERILDPFYTTKDVGEGLGLGLSIAYNAMRDFGGGMKIENRAAGGVCITLVFAAGKDGDVQLQGGEAGAGKHEREEA